MASPLLFLSILSVSSSMRRHWARVIFISTLLLAGNNDGMLVEAEPTLNMYWDDRGINFFDSNSSVMMLQMANLTVRSNPLVKIPLSSLPNVPPTHRLLKITSLADSNAMQFVIEIQNDKSPKSHNLGRVILYGFLGVTVTNLCALTGLVCIPIRKSKYYNLLIGFMTALAVGALCSTAVLVLIPEALRMVDMPAEFGGMGRAYLLKFICVLAGALFFYVVEYVLTILPRLLKWNVPPDCEQSPNAIATAKRYGHPHNILEHKVVAVGDMNSTNVSSATDDVSFDEVELVTDDKESVDPSVVSSSRRRRGRCCLPKITKEQLSNVAPVAWMILFGDGFHNMMDGLTIGAGFTESPTVGLALTLSILFEELPHELGDFAILLTSGMSVKAAVCANFTSACSAYIGLVIGLVIGEVSSGALYVFAITGGFFLYISLSDMLPTLRAGIEEAEESNQNSIKLFLLQLCGMVIGFSCVLMVTLVSDYIAF